jgi:hypothetical protein
VSLTPSLQFLTQAHLPPTALSDSNPHTLSYRPGHLLPSIHRAPAGPPPAAGQSPRRQPPSVTPFTDQSCAGSLAPPIPTFRAAGQGAAAHPIISRTKRTGCCRRNGPAHLLIGRRQNRPKHLLLGHGPSVKWWSAGRRSAPLTEYARAIRSPGWLCSVVGARGDLVGSALAAAVRRVGAWCSRAQGIQAARPCSDSSATGLQRGSTGDHGRTMMSRPAARLLRSGVAAGQELEDWQ